MKLDLEREYDKRRVVFWAGGIFALFVMAFLLLLFWWNQRIIPIDVSGCRTDEGYVKYKLKKNVKRDFIELSGYAYVPGTSVVYENITVVALNPADGVYYRLPTENVKNEKVTEKANDGHNYDYSSFYSIIPRRKAGNGLKIYILCRNNGEDILVDTGKEIRAK